MHAHDEGLHHDLQRLAQQAAQRRRALRWLSLGGIAPLAVLGCSAGAGRSAAAAGAQGPNGEACAVIPDETAGPFPADGTNRVNGSVVNALALSGIVRSDIRASIAGAPGVADGVPMSLALKLVNVGAACASLEGFAVYVWQCDALGRYSMYSRGATAQNYLRGVQATDASGTATFGTIFPGCYAGRVPHIHLEVYRSVASASSAASAANRIKTSQLAFPDAVANAVYASSGYGNSAANMAAVSLASDGIFSDGVALQMSAVSGSVAGGLVATLRVGIAA